MNFFSLICIVVVFWGSALPAWASTAFQQAMAEVTKSCIGNSCGGSFEKLLIFELETNTRLDAATEMELQKIAHEQAQVWGDTILEGDYEVDGKTRLDKVYLIQKNKQSIGYEIVYSEGAWKTDDCLYDGLNDSTLVGCLAGRITESSYVSLDFKEYFYELPMAAEFK